MTEPSPRARPATAPRRAQLVLSASLLACATMFGSGVSAAPPEIPIDPVVAPPSVPSGPVTVLEGYRTEHDLSFVIPAGRRVSADGTALATFRLPDLVTDAVVSAELNDAPIGSWLLGDGPTITTIAMTLPADTIVEGTNRLVLDMVIPLTIDGACPQSSHPARWIELLGDIAVEVPTTAGAATRLTGFPDVLQNDDDATTIVVEQLDSAHLTAAAAIGASITNGLGRDHALHLATDAEAAVGTVVALNVTAGRGGISIDADDRGLPRVDLTASDSDDLVMLATTFGQPGARSRMTGSSIDGTTVRNLATPEAPASGREAGTDWLAGLTLDELGYGPATLTGPGVDTSSYSFDLPLGDISSFMTITVEAAASAGGADWAPAIDAYVNGRLVGNGTLGDQLDSFDIDVPNQVLRPGTNFVRLEADLGTAGGCGAAPLPTRRIDIMGTTTFRLRHGSPIAPDLDDLPYLLRSSSDTAATVIVTPTDPTLDEAERAMQLAVLLGGRGRAATVATADAALEAGAEATHLVLIGTPGRQPLLAEYHRALPLGGTVPDRWPSDIEIQLGGVRHGASVQLAATAQDGVLLAVTGERDSDVIAALDALLDADLRSQLVGTMALVSSDPLNTISVRFDGLVPTSTVDRSSSAADRIEPVADASDDRATAATAAVAPAPGADRAPARRRTELVLIALGVAVLAGAVYALRRFGFTRPASSTLG